MNAVFANALTDAFKNVMDNPTVGGVIGLVVIVLLVGWVPNSDNTSGRPPGSPPPPPPPPTADQKEKDAVEAALKAYKEAKK